MNLRLQRAEVEHLRLWGRQAKDLAAGVGVPFEADEERLLAKLAFALEADRERA